MARNKQYEDRLTFCRDFVIDNVKFHLEYQDDNESIFLYIPEMVIVCKAGQLIELHPDILYVESCMLYPEILRYMTSDNAIKSATQDSQTKVFLPELLSVSDYVYRIAYEYDTDDFYLAIPARSFTTDLLTIDVVYPELTHMHNGLLMEIIKTSVA